MNANLPRPRPWRRIFPSKNSGIASDLATNWWEKRIQEFPVEMSHKHKKNILCRIYSKVMVITNVTTHCLTGRKTLWKDQKANYMTFNNPYFSVFYSCITFAYIELLQNKTYKHKNVLWWFVRNESKKLSQSDLTCHIKKYGSSNTQTHSCVKPHLQLCFCLLCTPIYFVK